MYVPMNVDNHMKQDGCESNGCSPEQCEGCAGCGDIIETITVKIEWQHKGNNIYSEEEVEECICALAKNLVISHVELIYFNNYFMKDVEDGHSLFLINGKPLFELVPEAQDLPLMDALEASIFKALL